DRREQIAVAAAARQAFSLEAERATGIDAGRNGKLDRPTKGRNADLRAKNRLVERDGQLEAQVGAFGLEQRMRCDRDADHGIARRAALAGQALTLEPDLLAVSQSRRDPDIDVLPGRQPQALR